MKVGDTISWWGGPKYGWVYAEVLAISPNGYPTVNDPCTGARRRLHLNTVVLTKNQVKSKNAKRKAAIPNT